MKLIKGELKDKVWDDVNVKVRKHAPYGSPVRKQIEHNLEWRWNINLVTAKIRNAKLNIMDDLDETT